MVKSHFELNVLEEFGVTWMYVFVVDWVVTFIASTGVQPTVSVLLWVMSEFDENADLSHDFVSIAGVGS